MRKAKHIKERKGNTGVYAALFVILLCVILAAVLLVQSGKGKAEVPIGTEPPTAIDAGEDAEPEASPSEILVPEPGTLLESRSGLNENFFSTVDYFGTASELTDETFFLGKAGMAFDRNAQPVFPAIVVHYGEDTVVKTATIYHAEDRYELYASSLDEFKRQMEGKEFLSEVDIVLEDDEAEELWAREIIITHYADLG